MKRVTGFLFCLLLLFFWSCYEFGPSGIIAVDDWGGKTAVRFINNNNFPVEIYYDAERFSKMIDLRPRSESEYIETSPNSSGALFYPTYRVVIESIALPYDGEPIIVRIDRGLNDIHVHLLSQLSREEKSKFLSDETYIGILNASSFSLTLKQGSTELPLEGMDSTILNSGEKGTYHIVSGSVASNYAVMKNTTTPLNFPPSITEFLPSRLYFIRYDGDDGTDNVVNVVRRELNIDQALRLNPKYNY